MTAAAAIVLAAGEGRRMGGPKALLVLDGKPLVRWHVERLREVDCQPIVVVVRTSILGQVGEVLNGLSRVLLVACDTSSMAASLSIGLEQVPRSQARTIVISTVDSLPAQRSTLHLLIAAAMVDGVQVATPRYCGRGGHPVVARESLLQVFRHGYPGTLRDLIRSVDAQRRRLDVDDAAVGHDFDTPADLAALRGE
jgi:CTP:molybdopterin cytidylyltransferase MocA